MMTMRRKANVSLLLLALLFVGAAICLYYYPGEWWSRLLLYTAEAGLVGALADLFAVTVLFRHPFGWRWVPHTAIIPRNRDKLVDGVVQMVEQQLFSKEQLLGKLKQFRLVDALIRWVDTKQGAAAERGWELLVSLLRKTDVDRLSTQLDRHAREALSGVNLSAYGGAALKWVLRNSDVQQWIGHIVDYAAQRTAGEETKAAITAMLSKEKDKFVNEGGSFTRWLKQKLVDFAEAADAINLEDAAATLHRDLQSFMNDLRNPEHELRMMIVERLHDLASHLEESEDAAVAIEAWKRDLLEHLSLEPSIRALLGTVQDLLTGGADVKYIVRNDKTLRLADIKDWMMELLSSYWEWFKSDQETKEQLERYTQQFIMQTIESEHAVIGRIVRRTLEGFTEQRLVQFIESKVETDLQRIRLNGAFIGAAVGAALFLFLHGVYAPLLSLLQQ